MAGELKSLVPPRGIGSQELKTDELMALPPVVITATKNQLLGPGAATEPVLKGFENELADLEAAVAMCWQNLYKIFPPSRN